jgi:hypothetical protein
VQLNKFPLFHPFTCRPQSANNLLAKSAEFREFQRYQADADTIARRLFRSVVTPNLNSADRLVSACYTYAGGNICSGGISAKTLSL